MKNPFLFTICDLIVYDGPVRPWGVDDRCFGRIFNGIYHGRCTELEIIWLTPEGWKRELGVIQSHCRFPTEEELAVFAMAKLEDFPQNPSRWAKDK